MPGTVQRVCIIYLCSQNPHELDYMNLILWIRKPKHREVK